MEKFHKILLELKKRKIPDSIITVINDHLKEI
jgi:hypothetical protein